MNRLRDLLVDGLLLAIPLGAAGFLLKKAIALLSRFLVPVAHLLPQGRWFGIAGIELAAFGVLVLGLILLGAFARTTPGKRFVATIESVVLSKVPGYLIVKTIAADLAATEKGTDLRPALVSFDDNTVLGFLVEEPAGTDACTLFIPSAPGAATGSVVIVPRERVQPLDASTGSAMRAMKQRGLGLQKLGKPPTTAPRG
jgi:uncharacterized membrane protein